MLGTHDPYLVTAKRTFNEERIQSRRKKLNKKKNEPKGFFSQEIHIEDYIYLPESLQKVFIISLFILLPYMVGLITITILNGYKDGFQEYSKMLFNIFMFTWTVGYEILALMLILLIIKSAFTFKKEQ